MEKTLEEIRKLKSGERYIVPEADYGKAEIWRINGRFILFEIPMFGGEPQFWNHYSLHEAHKVVKAIESWA